MSEQDEQQQPAEETPAVVVQAGLASGAAETGPAGGPEDED